MIDPAPRYPTKKISNDDSCASAERQTCIDGVLDAPDVNADVMPVMHDWGGACRASPADIGDGTP